MALRVVDLFCGAGGLSEGFRQAGYNVLGGSDVDPDACATYRLNFPDAYVGCGDLRDPDVKKDVLEVAKSCDVVAGGPPCQAFSQVRNHTRIIDDPRNSLYREFVWVVRAAEPRAFVMENVPGMDQLGVREQITQDLTIGGRYSVSSRVVDAADVGVPQTRQRIIFIGVHRDLGLAAPELVGNGVTSQFRLTRSGSPPDVRYDLGRCEPVTTSRCAQHSLADPADLTCISVEQAIGDLVVLRTGRRDDRIAFADLPAPASAYQRLMRGGAGVQLSNVQVPRMNKDTALRLSAVPEGGNYRDLPDEFHARYLTGQRWGPSNGTGKLTRKHYYAYRRLHRAIWAWTLNTKADSAYHYESERALSVREFARLQSFPDRFIFTTDERKGELPGRITGGAAHSRYRQVGNAVPPLLGKRIATAISDTIAAPASMESRLHAG